MAKSSRGFRARQPGKTAWSVIAAVHITTRMLVLGIYYIPKFTRQNPHWTYRNAITNEFMRMALQHAAHLELLYPLSLEPGAEKDRFVLMEPEDDIYHGVLDDPTVRPAIIGGTWYPKSFEAGDEKKRVVLHFHGGSFIFGSGRQSEWAAAAGLLTKHIASMALFVQYRLASHPSCCFPASVQDALTAYNYLLKKGFQASDIIISGDSAGGNIAVALLRFISEQSGQKILPTPQACLLWSPSIDLVTQNPREIDQHRNRKTDYLPGFVLEWGINLYVPEGADMTGPWFSPLRHPFATKAPIWMMTGQAEVLTDTIVGFASRMKAVEGNRVGLCEIPNAPHDVFVGGHVMGWAEEADEAARDAARFLAE